MALEGWKWAGIRPPFVRNVAKTNLRDCESFNEEKHTHLLLIDTVLLLSLLLLV
jgi:hypothetical protein